MAFAPFDLTGKVALITGGNSGIGLGMAEGIAQAGGDVMHLGNQSREERSRGSSGSPDTVRAFRRTCATFPMRDAVATRVRRKHSTHTAASTVVSPTPGSGGAAHAFDEMPFDEWRRVMSVNLDGVYHTFQHAAGHMRERGEAGDPGGRLVATASLAAISGQPRGEHYAATKGALVSMIKALAVEYARYGVTAHTILPGWIETAMTAPAFGYGKFVDNVMKRIPARRWGRPEDFRGDRRLHHERRERVSHRRYVSDRRRLLQFLARGELSMIQAVLWDFGGVLTTSPFDAFNRYEAENGIAEGLHSRHQRHEPRTQRVGEARIERHFAGAVRY